ncbi:MAG TPA: PilZ domain-containing protein [Pirellulales bacterium]|nr:PilZ domain-containing protein [Pirellulales bacterium]
MEQRRYERVDFLCDLELTAARGGATRPARSLDLSLGGVGAVTPSSFEFGELVTVAFLSKDSAQREFKDEIASQIVDFAADVDTNRLVRRHRPMATRRRFGTLARRL